MARKAKITALWTTKFPKKEGFYWVRVWIPKHKEWAIRPALVVIIKGVVVADVLRYGSLMSDHRDQTQYEKAHPPKFGPAIIGPDETARIEYEAIKNA